MKAFKTFPLIMLVVLTFASPAAWDHKSGAMDSLKESLGLYDDTIDG